MACSLDGEKSHQLTSPNIYLQASWNYNATSLVLSLEGFVIDNDIECNGEKAWEEERMKSDRH